MTWLAIVVLFAQSPSGIDPMLGDGFVIAPGDQWAATGDFNADGLADVAVVGVSAWSVGAHQTRISVMLADEDGRLVPRQLLAVDDAEYIACRAADSDGDGAIDLVCAGRDGTAVFTGAGEGLFATTPKRSPDRFGFDEAGRSVLYRVEDAGSGSVVVRARDAWGEVEVDGDGPRHDRSFGAFPAGGGERVTTGSIAIEPDPDHADRLRVDP